MWFIQPALTAVVSPNNVEASRTVLRRHADELAAVIVDPMPQRLMAEPLTQACLIMSLLNAELTERLNAQGERFRKGMAEAERRAAPNWHAGPTIMKLPSPGV